MKLKGILFLFSLVFRYTFSQTYSDIHVNRLEIPELKPTKYIVNHLGYSFSYNDTMEQANWVAYELTSEETVSLFKRTNKFMVDPFVKTGSANNADYLGTGYDRGHLAPAGDMGWSETAMVESFYYSNMSPQEPGFNRGIWKKAEDLVRKWAREYHTLYVVTGPVLTCGLITIGANKVAVPKLYYKVILDYRKSETKGIGFIMANTGSTNPLESFAVTIDSVEKVTGINFFPLLPDEREEVIESTLSIASWSWPAYHVRPDVEQEEIIDSHTELTLQKEDSKTVELHESSEKAPKDNIACQCSGTTKKGARCKNTTKNASGRCHLH